jgi:hypothetical protein
MAGIRALGLAVLACALLPVPVAAAAPPPNDNYLASLLMQDGEVVAREFSDAPVTTEATVQADLFNPSRDGIPFGGKAGPEPTKCGPVSYGNTVWYDFLPEVSGGVQILASGYDTVVAVYEYDVATAELGKQVECANRGVAEDVLIPKVEAGKAYTVQVGAVGGAAARLQFEFLFFADRDEDEVLDELDRCPSQPGIDAAGGCPPKLAAALSLEWANTANGVRFTRVRVRGVPRGGRVEARCRSCGVRRTVAQGRGRPVSLRKLVGREAPAGAVLEVFVTRRARGSGRYRHGAIGSYLRYTFEPAGIRKRTVRCLRPGSMKPRRRCT